METLRGGIMLGVAITILTVIAINVFNAVFFNPGQNFFMWW